MDEISITKHEPCWSECGLGGSAVTETEPLVNDGAVCGDRPNTEVASMYCLPVTKQEPIDTEFVNIDWTEAEEKITEMLVDPLLGKCRVVKAESGCIESMKEEREQHMKEEAPLESGNSLCVVNAEMCDRTLELDGISITKHELCWSEYEVGDSGVNDTKPLLNEREGSDVRPDSEVVSMYSLPVTKQEPVQPEFMSVDCSEAEDETTEMSVDPLAVAEHRRETNKTGGGPAPTPVSPMMEKVAAIIGETAISGIPGGGLEFGFEEASCSQQQSTGSIAPETDPTPSNEPPVALPAPQVEVVELSNVATQTAASGGDYIAAHLEQGEQMISMQSQQVTALNRIANILEKFYQHFMGTGSSD